jgi:hypothetical protein
MTPATKIAVSQSMIRSMTQMMKTVMTSVMTLNAEIRISAKIIRPPVVMFRTRIEELVFTWNKYGLER